VDIEHAKQLTEQTPTGDYEPAASSPQCIRADDGTYVWSPGTSERTYTADELRVHAAGLDDMNRDAPLMIEPDVAEPQAETAIQRVVRERLASDDEIDRLFIDELAKLDAWQERIYDHINGLPTPGEKACRECLREARGINRMLARVVDSFSEFQQPGRVEPQPEPTYRAFRSAAEFAPHRDRWLRNKKHGAVGIAIGYGCEGVRDVSDRLIPYSKLFELCVFDDDGTPCGVKTSESEGK
jgi:hypothetical protein